jgi:CO/xanthine dehydrogenase Mo-binding subunit
MWKCRTKGAAIMGLGHCLMEHIVLDDTGRIRNLGALDYSVPTTKDVPRQLFAAMVETSVAPAAAGNEHRAAAAVQPAAGWV